MSTSALPVTAIIPELLPALATHVCILQAPPGAGKSTAIPLALLAALPITDKQLIILVQPRRVAAVSIAHYLAETLGEQVGERVGYWVRQERKNSAKTRLLVVTDGMLTRMLQRNPELPDVGLIIFDEFHERNLHCDLGLALALEARELKPELQLLIMSATLPGAALAQWLTQQDVANQVFHSSGRQFPIQHYYRSPAHSADWLKAMPAVIYEALALAEQGVLVFLPGQREIRWLRQQLSFANEVCCIELYGGLALAEQRVALTPLAKGQGIKLVLATNVAETSLTIPDIDVVVDSGRERQAKYLPKYQFTQLQTRYISQAAATQRAGRAGRTGPGYCFRMWPEGMQQGFAAYAVPAIESEDLRSLVIEACAWGSAPEQMAWFTPPPSNALHSARAQLCASGLLAQKPTQHDGYQLTDIGRAAQRFGADIDVANMLALVTETPRYAEDIEYRQAAILLAGHFDAQEHREPGELRDVLQELLAAAKVGMQRNGKGAHRYRQTQRRLAHWSKVLEVQLPEYVPSNEILAELLLQVMPKRLCQLQTRPVSSGKSGAVASRYQMATGVALQPAGGAQAEWPQWYLATQLSWQEKDNEARMWQGLALSDTWLKEWVAKSIPVTESWRWQGNKGKLQLVAEQRLGALLFSEQALAAEPNEEQRLAAVAEVIKARGTALFSATDNEWLLRVQMAAQELNLSAADWQPSQLVANFSAWAMPYLMGVKTYQQALAWQPREALRAYFGQATNYRGEQQLAELLPLVWQAPSGRSHKIVYEQHGAAVCALKLQEVFGTPISPQLLRGNLVLTFELLSPAGRPLQKTNDLASFWRNGYVDVRKEMRGRYPKHPWPEHPESAQATHLTKRALGNQEQR